MNSIAYCIYIPHIYYAQTDAVTSVKWCDINQCGRMLCYKAGRHWYDDDMTTLG